MRNTTPAAKALLFTLYAFQFSSTAQSQKAVQKSRYELRSAAFFVNVEIPDKLRDSNSQQTIPIPVGKFFYTNFFQERFSRTEISFEASPGIRISGAQSEGSIVTSYKDKIYLLYENGLFVNGSKFVLPALDNRNRRETVNGHLSALYSFTSADSTKIDICFSKDLPYYVNPGICYKDLGGITKLVYDAKGEKWSVELLSTEAITQTVSFTKTDLSKASKDKMQHFILKGR